MKKVLVTSTNLMMRQFLVPHVKNLCNHGFQVDIACSDVGGRFEELEEIFQGTVKIYKVNLHRSPARLDNLNGLKQLKKIIKDGHYDLVWTNEPVMGVMTRLAAAPERKHGLKVMYMAHGFHFFKGAPLKNWLIYYQVEKWMSHYTDTLVTINNEDYALAQRKMHAGRVEYIPGIGVDTKKFAPGRLSKREREAYRSSLGLKEGDKMLLSVGELSERKNHEVVIRAIAELDDPTIKYYICGRGELQEQLQKLTEKLGLTGFVKLLGFREDVSKLCECADLFILPSLQEGLPVALMEAIASKTPVICSNIRGNRELVRENSFFDCHDVDAVARKIKEYLLESKLVEAEENYQNLREFDLSLVMDKLSALYADGGVNHLCSLYDAQQLRKALGIPQNAFLLLSVGELQNRKNHRVVIEALHKLKNPNICYALAGIGELLQEYEKLITKYGLENTVKLLGFRKDIPELCKTADCFIHPSLREGFGIAPMEAMASGLPLISADINGLKDYTKEGVTGCCVNPQLVDEVEAAITKMYVDRAFRRRCGNNNIEIARDYNLERSQASVWDVIRTNIEKR